jgi:hypothetical protein
VAEFLGENPPSFLLRGEPMAPVEDDRSLAGNIADGPADPVDKDPLDNGHARKVDDHLHVHGRLLAGEHEQAPCPVTGKIVAYLSAA